MKLLHYALLIGIGITLNSCTSSREIPNILIILVDDMGYGWD